MRKILILACMLCGLVVKANAQLLYKVTLDSIHAPSYVVASHPYLNPVGVVGNIDSIKEAITNTNQVVLDINRTAYAASLSDAEKLPAGKTLAGLLSPAQAKLFDAFLKKYTEVGWNSPYNQRRYNGKTPLAVLAELTRLLFVANHMGEYDPTNSFYACFEAQAKKNGEPVYGLTDVDGYVAQLQNMPLTDQTAQLVGFLENPSAMLTTLDKSVEAYDNKDMDAAALSPLAIGVKPDLKAWTAKMGKMMTEAPTLFVLPAYTLGGSEGVLARLQAEGATIESVK